MSAEAAHSTDGPDTVMHRENAFVVGDEQHAGERRQREDYDQIQAEIAAEARRTIEEKARQGVYTRARAARLGVDKIEGFKPLAAPYLHAEHLYERIDEEEYDHPLYGKVRGFQYGPCLLCGKTLQELAGLPPDQKPNMFLCMEKHRKAVAMGYGNKNNYAKARNGGNANGNNNAKKN